MVNIILVQLILTLLSLSLYAAPGVDRVYTNSYLGEKNIEGYSDRYQPLVLKDVYQGKMSFKDDLFFQNYFNHYLFIEESDFSNFLKSELSSGLLCPNETLSNHFDDIQFSYRLIALSYLLEGQWHNSLMANQLRAKDQCEFNIKKWADSCKPKSPEMKKFVAGIKNFNPRYEDKIPYTYTKNDWFKEYRSKSYKWYSQYRLEEECGRGCLEENMAKNFQKVCADDEKLMTLICSENDEIHGLSESRLAYVLLGRSNIINTYNKRGEALGCLRRFSEVMASREVHYKVFNRLFPVMQTYLASSHGERFLQGRVFFFGSGKEFEEKGLKDLYVKDQPLKIEEAPKLIVEKAPEPVKAAPVIKASVAKAGPKIKTPEPPAPKLKVKEIPETPKSAFLIAAEFRKKENLKSVEVDMLKLRYDYVFSLNTLNQLASRIGSFMTREALKEMMEYDKLGTKDGPVPLIFIKYMIDMQEHHGLWNILSILGDRFYVSNELDSSFKPEIEYVELVHNPSVTGQWQLIIIKP